MTLSRPQLTEQWQALDPAWRCALTAYVTARLLLCAWSFVILTLFPAIVQNLDLFGAPVLAAFNLQTGERFAYSRVVRGETLAWRAAEPGYAVDLETGSRWDLASGRAVQGAYAGQSLAASEYGVEDIFPYRGVPPEPNVWLSAWQRFDTNWYLDIAARGYASPGSTVYLPLYPVLIRIVGGALGNPMLAALVVSNLACIGALWLVYRLGARVGANALTFGLDSSAARAAVLWLLFPTAFFLLAGYTESLFLLLALGALECGAQRRWQWAGGLAALAALTRLQGVALVLPLAYQWWRSAPRLRTGLWLGLVPAATASFLAATDLSLLNIYAGQLHAQFVWPWENVWACAQLLASGQGSMVDGLNLLLTLLFAAALVPVWRTLPREYALYASVMLLAPLVRMTTTQLLVSMARYVLALVPVFVLLGQWSKNPWLMRALVYLGFPLQLYFSAQFMLWGWVG